MRELSETSFSQEACVAAVRDYYRFLVQLYLDESAVIQPPEDGWPEITTDSLRKLGKNDRIPFCPLADWRALSIAAKDGYDVKLTTERELSDDIPSSVVGLTNPPRNDTLLFLDTNLGVVYWPDCWGEIRSTTAREQVYYDPYDWAPEQEADWRGSAAVWVIEDFFEMLKDQFRELRFVPASPWRVLDVFTGYHPDEKGLIPMLQDIYRSHGWPDLERYNKRDCLRDVKAALEKHYPDYAESW